MSATSEAPAAFRHAAARSGPVALLVEGLDEFRTRRRLIRYLVQADIRKKGADTFLGNLWWVMDPLLQMGVYVVFVSLILAVKTPDFPLFVLSVVLPWKWFTSTVNDAAQSVVSQGALIRQIQFPKVVLPLAASSAAVVGFMFGLIPLAGIMLFYPHRISPYLVFIPVVAATQFLFTLGLALLVAAINVFFRDLGNVLRHLLRFWFYLSPGLYSLATLDHSATFRAHPLLQTLAHANPVGVLFEAYRAAIYGTPDGAPQMPDMMSLAGLTLGSLILLAFGIIVFKRLEPSFAKVL